MEQYVVEMHNQLHGPFSDMQAAQRWGDANHDPKDPPGKRFLIRRLISWCWVPTHSVLGQHTDIEIGNLPKP